VSKNRGSLNCISLSLNVLD